MMMMKSAIVMMLLVALLAAASSASADRSLDFQNILNLEAKEVAERQPQKVTLSIGNKKIVHLVTLPWDHCVPQGDPCGLLDWCCGSLRCTGVIPGQQYVYGTCS